MDGFAAHGGSFHRALGYYTDRDHPFYTWMFNTFATSDRYFSARLGDTALNRHYLFYGMDTPLMTDAPSILHRLIEHGVDVRAYRGSPGGMPLDPILVGRHGPIPGLIATLRGEAGSTPLETLSAGSIRFPASEHPPEHDLHEGEAGVRAVVTALLSGPYWRNTVLIMNYDEGGGFHDHVPPSLACAPDGGLERRGFRTPFYVVSPFARRGFVSHRTHDHTSVMRFLEALFQIPALTRRDANADALLDLFDFAHPGTAAPTSIPSAAPLDPHCDHVGLGM
jgi:phospholipase C